MVEEIKRRIARRFYDSHPGLPLDPDSDQYKIVQPIHTDPWHIVVVFVGAFFGTLARYGAGLALPAGKDGWPTATLLINIMGAFLLGVLLQALVHHGKDEGGRRVLRLALGTGFLGAFTTYSSLAVGVVTLARGGHVILSIAYAVISVGCGIFAGALGILAATRQYNRRRGAA